MLIDFGRGALVASMVASMALSAAAIAFGSGPNRYVDCRKVCAPAAVKVQEGRHGRCECWPVATGDE